MSAVPPLSLYPSRVSIHALYYHIAQQQAQVYQDQTAEHQRLDNDKEGSEENLKQKEACYERIRSAAVIAVTFAGMAIEAFLYDYAATQLGDDYVRKHLDRLDPKSKFLVYPQLICGKQPDKNGPAYKSLSQLVKLRNDFVHFKSRPFPALDPRKAEAIHDELDDRLRTGVRESIECVTLVMDELDRLHECAPKYRDSMKWTGVT